MTTTTKRNTPARTTRPMTAERWRESFADRIAFAGALLPDETDRERLGVWIAADALRLLCPVPRDPPQPADAIEILKRHAKDLPGPVSR
jgi:hypothetical protein